MTKVEKRLVAVMALLASVVACSDDEASGTGDAGSSGSPPGPSTDRIDAAAIAACPKSSTLLTTPDWITCLAGRSVAGKEPFGGATCELRVGQGGAFEYVRNGAVALSVPPRASWGSSAFGTYQNGNDSFIAAVSPNLPAIPGAAKLERLSVLFAARGIEDKIEVDYTDAALGRATYACSVEVL